MTSDELSCKFRVLNAEIKEFEKSSTCTDNWYSFGLYLNAKTIILFDQF